MLRMFLFTWLEVRKVTVIDQQGAEFGVVGEIEAS